MQENINNLKKYTFDYLQALDIVLWMSCSKSMKGMGLVIKISECMDLREQRVVGNLPALSSRCDRAYTMDPYLHVYRVFIFKTADSLHRATTVSVDYLSCSEECRQYSYFMIVLGTYANARYEYKTQVGQNLSTDIRHNGFRLSIIPPADVCANRCACTLRIVCHPLVGQRTRSSTDLLRRQYRKGYRYHFQPSR